MKSTIMKHKKRKQTVHRYLDATITTDPAKAAVAVGLQYVSDDRPGIRRKRKGKNKFIYIGVDGKPIRDPQEIDRIRVRLF